MAYLEMQATSWFGGPDGLCENLLDFLVGTEVEDESMGTPNGVLVNFAGTLTGYPVPKSRIIINYTVGATPYTATDNAAGFIVGTHITTSTSTLDYVTGDFNLDFTTAPDSATTLTADYIYGNPGEDWRLIRSTYARPAPGGVLTPLDSVDDTVSSYTLGAGDGIETVFSIASVPSPSYVDAVFATWAPYLEFTIGGTAYQVGCHEIADQLHWNSAATDSKLIGSNTRFQTSGQFYHAEIASSSISWESDRAVTVTFNTAPDDTTDVVLKYWIYPEEKLSAHEYIIGNVGNNGVEPIYLGLFQRANLPAIGRFYVTAWNQWNFDPANVLGMYSGQGISQPPDFGYGSSWLEDLSINVYSNNGRVACFFETQTGYYQSFYHGHFLRACSPEFYANPIFVGGNLGDNYYAHNSDVAAHSMFAKLQISSASRKYVCLPDNSWLESDDNNLYSDLDDYVTTEPIESMTNGGIMCQPVYFWAPLNGIAQEFLGSFDGLFWTPSAALSSLDLVDDGVDDYRVFSDIGKTLWYQFCAMKRE